MRIREPNEHIFLDKSNEDPYEDPCRDLNFFKIVATLFETLLPAQVGPFFAPARAKIEVADLPTHG